MSEKTYKLNPEKRKYFREKIRKSRLPLQRCGVCQSQAYAKILSTGEKRCARCLVTPLKEEILKEKKEA